MFDPIRVREYLANVFTPVLGNNRTRIWEINKLWFRASEDAFSDGSSELWRRLGNTVVDPNQLVRRSFGPTELHVTAPDFAASSRLRTSEVSRSRPASASAKPSSICWRTKRWY